MIWSLVKIVVFVFLVASMTYGVAYVIDAGGEIRVAIGNQEFSLTPLAGMITFAVILIGAWVALRLFGLIIAVLHFFNGDETAISRYFDRNRERRGFQALADGMMALASGEGRLAMAKASKAEKYLQKPELTLLLSAQAAEMSGDTKQAQSIYKKLLTDDRTRFVGVHGILKQKLAEGDTDTALKLAEKAFALRPKHENTMDVLFSLQSDKADWSGARKTLGAKLRAKSLPKDVHTRRDAVLALAEAREKIDGGDVAAGKAAAFQANRLSPDLIPAAILASEMHVLDGSVRNANKVLRKAWGTKPHPELAAAFAEIKPDETPKQRQTRFQTLLKLNPGEPESKMLAAELALVAEDFPAARKHIGKLVEDDPTTRSLTIMAAIERGEGSPDNVVRGWLTKALNASRGPQWMCTSCKNIHSAWAPVCENCGHFDTLAWEVPPATSERPQGTTDMLPLIVGSLEDKSKDTQSEAVDTADEAETDIDVQPIGGGLSASVVTPSDPSDDLDGIIGDPPVLPTVDAEKT